jgi:hypothetical protein
MWTIDSVDQPAHLGQFDGLTPFPLDFRGAGQRRSALSAALGGTANIRSW